MNKVLYKFSSPTCVPCKVMGDRIKLIDLNNTKLIEVDVTKDKDLAIKYNIKAVPTFVIEEDNKILATKIGIMSVEELQSLVGP